MSSLEELLEGNARYVSTEWDPRDAELDAPPSKRLAVVACMDARYNVERVLGLQNGDAKIIRNAGNVVDDGALRSLVVAVHLLGVDTVTIMGHTKCGMTTVGTGNPRIAESIAEKTGTPRHEVARPDFERWLGGFPDVEEHVRRGMALVRNHPYLPRDLTVHGLVYDNASGRVHPVKA